ncbi:DJ-1/PfpI family protein [Nitrogeniibacter mangrovi]|uniref:DJ-1/PfpI family protein n=1 Tax=Nitrogeniibacter mangrovi TaxID=2016596 RepID=A0A6C1BAD4_9RHOO|nr:DJ-1/PfpI family protein [Nitrogeniibacter mangrovi]QID19340.1 DJ-1/PfpI family protein [Nitrogeniibacter mangrovi]
MELSEIAGLRPDMLDREQVEPAIHKTVGILIFPGFELLDVYGPMDLWSNINLVPSKLWGDKSNMVGVKLVTVASEKGDIPSHGGVRTVADYGYADAPHLDYLIVPGGWGAVPLVEDQPTLDWLRARADRAEIVMSVCNGASLLAAAGILDGREATTNKLLWNEATAPGPRVNWIKKARWVDLGNIITASGIAAGIDMTHALISRLYGEDVGKWIELWTEYEPHRDPSWDPYSEMAGLVG